MEWWWCVLLSRVSARSGWHIIFGYHLWFHWTLPQDAHIQMFVLHTYPSSPWIYFSYFEEVRIEKKKRHEAKFLLLFSCLLFFKPSSRMS
jgi:hypothetical protein